MGLVFLLVLIRMYESKLFYDPFLDYFKESFIKKDVPEFDSGKLLLHQVIRYGINTFISLVLLKVIFKKNQYVKVSGFLFLVMLLILLPVYFFLLHNNPESNLLTIFYIRRFLIHPLLVFILIPAFYYQMKFPRE